jgi:hypothetical protein
LAARWTWSPNPFLMVDLVAVHVSMSGRYGAPGNNVWPQRTAI